MALSNMSLHILVLTGPRAGHWTSMCSRSPTVSLQVSAKHIPCLLVDQCLVKYSDLKRPDFMRAKTVAFLDSKLVLAVVQIMLGNLTEQLLAMKKLSEGKPVASFLSRLSQ